MDAVPELWRKVPKERRANLKYRLWVMEQASHSQQVRDGLYAACKNDLIFYVNTFVMTFDPRTSTKTLPFVTYAYQDRALRYMHKAIIDSQEPGGPNADVVIEKSRDMGASWLSLLLMEWLWHFHPGNSFLMISRNADLVDKSGDPDALFWKLDFVHQNLPEWMMPPGWVKRKHRLDMHFENPDTGSTIDGYATTGAAGVGGRRTAMFIDEFSRIDAAAELLSGTADTTRCRIFNFTPWGTGHPSYKLAKRTDVRKLRMGWWEHPDKNRGLYKFNELTQQIDFFDCKPDGSLETLPGPKYEYEPDYVFQTDGVLRSPVYDAEDKRRANRREMAEMWDIDYAGSSYQFYPRNLILELQREFSRDPLWEGDIDVDPLTGTGRLVEAAGGPLKLWINPIKNGDGWSIPVGRYGAGADVSEGTGATNSCFSIASMSTRQKVLEYATPFKSAEQFAVICVALCRLFATSTGEGAYFAWEMQGPGVRFGKVVMQLGYHRVYLRTNETSYSKKTTDTPGWYPTPDNKLVLHGEYRAALQAREFINPSKVALEECLLFVTTQNQSVEHSGALDCDDPTGAGKNHGDRVVADALAHKMIGPMPKGVKEPPPGEIPVMSLAWRRQMHDINDRKQNDEWR